MVNEERLLDRGLEVYVITTMISPTDSGPSRGGVVGGVTPPRKNTCEQMRPQTYIFRKIGKIWVIPAPHAQLPRPL